MSRPTSPLIVGDFLVHHQKDGRAALHDIRTWRDNGQPIRSFGTLAEAKAAAHGELNGGRIWFSHWEAPDDLRPF